MYLFKNSRFAFVWTVTTIALIVLLVYNTLVYFQLGVRAEFLTEKGPLVKNRLWLTAFYFHVFSSCVVLLTGAILFFSSLLKYRRMHLVLGYIYINIVLWIAAPTGLILSPVAKGGWPGALGFAVTGLAWWYTTWAGYRAIRQRRVNDHIAWMVRSWCLSLSAVTFRVLHIAFCRGLRAADQLRHGHLVQFDFECLVCGSFHCSQHSALDETAGHKRNRSR